MVFSNYQVGPTTHDGDLRIIDRISPASRQPDIPTGFCAPRIRERLAKSETHQLALADRIERALILLAYFIELDGDVHIPMYEKFEAELDALQKMQATRDRARERLFRHAKPRRPEGDSF